MNRSPALKAALLLFAGLAGSASAGTNGFFAPYFRGSPGGEAGYWEIFTVAAGPPGNRADRGGSTTDAVLTQLDPTGFLTGSGNIYNLDHSNVFSLNDATFPALGTVVVQTRALGNEIDYDSMVLTYVNGSGPHTLAPLPRVELDRTAVPGLGIAVSSLWQWDLGGLGASSYTVAFRAPPSTSFDSMTLDAWDRFAPLFTPPFQGNDTEPAIERWMYANNAAPCDRPAGSVFGTMGDEAGVDTRHAQHLLGWDTAAIAPAGRGPSSYLVRRCRVTLTINRGNLFEYDPTQDSYRTFLDPADPNYLPDADTGRPVELFGVGYRNGYDAASFDQCAPFGSNAPAQRNAYAAGWTVQGRLADISNNVGKTNTAYPSFEVAPFALGRTTAAAAGQLVPAGAQITFDLNLADPFVLAYIQSGLHSGRLRFMASSIHTTTGQFGTPKYPDFATRFNEAVLTPTRLEIEGVAVGPGDVDADGLPDDWELYYLHGLAGNAAADPDRDGASNLAELRSGTDPLSAPSCLRILSLSRDVEGRPVLSFPHAASYRYTVETSEDFSHWTPSAREPEFELGAGIAHWSDAAAEEEPTRFYRVRSELAAP